MLLLLRGADHREGRSQHDSNKGDILKLHHRFSSRAMILTYLSILAIFTLGAAPVSKSVEEAYPGLASGILQKAKVERLEKGMVLKSQEVKITESYLQEQIQKADPKIQGQLKKNLFFFLEQEALNRILLNEARKSSKTPEVDEQEIIAEYLTGKVTPVKVTDPEVEAFYRDNKEMMGGMPFEQVKESIEHYLGEQKRRQAISGHIYALVEKASITVDAAWVEKQNTLARDNPVDRARSSGKPTLVEFGAKGCVPCDMMQPILEALKKKYKDRLAILFVHVGEEQILGARYGISSIPVQVFFDKTGKETFRHTGFYKQEEVEKRLAEMGVR